MANYTSGAFRVEVSFKGFSYVEVGEIDEDTFYVPTGERLTARPGQDWY